MRCKPTTLTMCDKLDLQSVCKGTRTRIYDIRSAYITNKTTTKEPLTKYIFYICHVAKINYVKGYTCLSSFYLAPSVLILGFSVKCIRHLMSLDIRSDAV